MKYTVSLKKNIEFRYVYRKGRYYVGKFLILYVIESYEKENINMLGVSASKKVGKSVCRNRLRRLVKECYRFCEDSLGKGFSFVFVIRKGEYTQTYPSFLDIGKDVKSLLSRAGIYVC